MRMRNTMHGTPRQIRQPAKAPQTGGPAPIQRGTKPVIRKPLGVSPSAPGLQRGPAVRLSEGGKAKKGKKK